MNRGNIAFLRSLDPLGLDGTIQSVLVDEDITTKSFEAVAMHLLKQLKKEKEHLVLDNIRLSKELNIIKEK